MTSQKKKEIQDKILDHMLITGKKVVRSDSDTNAYYWELLINLIRKNHNLLEELGPDNQAYSYLASLNKTLTEYAMEIKKGRHIDLKDVFILSNISSI